MDPAIVTFLLGLHADEPWKELAGQSKQRGVLIAGSSEVFALLSNNVVPWYL